MSIPRAEIGNSLQQVFCPMMVFNFAFAPLFLLLGQSKCSLALTPPLASVGASDSPVTRKTSVFPHASMLNPCLHQGDMAFSWESSLLRISSIYILTNVGVDGKQGSELNVLGRCLCWLL